MASALQTLALILQPVVAAVLYAAMGYARNRAKDGVKKINFKKLGATMVVAVGVGLAAFASGAEVSQSYISTQMAAYGFAVPLVMQFLEAVKHRFAN